MKTLLLIILGLVSFSVSDDLNKRLVLHSDQDVMQALAAVQSELAAFKNKVSSLELELKSVQSSGIAGGVTYVRWGRTSCPSNGTQLVYKGYMAGDHYTDYGGGSNNLCLPEDPTWGKFVDGYSNGATIYGTEIELDDAVSTALFGKATSNQDIPCALCQSSRASQVMFPARIDCYPGWTEEYVGYLTAAHPTWKGKSDYVCLDAQFEFLPHGAANDNEHVIRPVEVRCGQAGSLPCPPFVDGRELACVVCSK